jgi:SAM-dependent methyltransferase
MRHPKLKSNRRRAYAQVRENYSAPSLLNDVRHVINASAKDPSELHTENSASFGQFHLNGINATRLLANLSSVTSSMRVLDVGCGIGGAGRTLVEEFGASVVGIDMSFEYAHSASLLNGAAGLSTKFHVCVGDALSLPVGSGKFDLVWAQHVGMNVRDKSDMFREFARVLRANGTLSIYEIYSGRLPLTHYPVPWARDATSSFLISQKDIRGLIADQGFVEVSWYDMTDQALDGLRAVRPVLKQPSSRELGLHLLVDDFGCRIQNLRTNLEEGRLSVASGIFTAIGRTLGC